MNNQIIARVLLLVKHWYIDFVNQTNDEVHHKGIYGSWIGVRHSIKQAIPTAVIMLLLTTPEYAAIIAVLDLVTHYHIDWIKRNYGNQDIRDPLFWNHLGLDQLAHQLCYIAYIIIV